MEVLVLGMDNLKVILLRLMAQKWSSSDANSNVSTFNSFQVVLLNFIINQFILVFIHFGLEEFCAPRVAEFSFRLQTTLPVLFGQAVWIPRCSFTNLGFVF